MKAGFYQRRGKRWLDASAAVVLMGALVPLFLLVGLAVRAVLGTPVLFRQARPGRGGRPFTLVKFRTMRNARDARGVLLPDEERLTTLGLFLRSTSLDELPELWNVVRGDMSLVGPRPLLVEYLGRYSSRQARRHEVRPGITGWAQVNGRNVPAWEQRLEYDVWYVDHHGLRLDLRILLKTVWTVLRGQGVNARGQAVIPLFFGGADRLAPEVVDTTSSLAMFPAERPRTGAGSSPVQDGLLGADRGDDVQSGAESGS